MNSVRLPALVLVLFLSLPALPQAQNQGYLYRIVFNDKGDQNTSSYDPALLFSNKALERRKKHNIAGIDFHDLPVYKPYIAQISGMGMGLELKCTSRWMNSALFWSANPVVTENLAALPSVKEVMTVKIPGTKGINADKLSLALSPAEIPFDRPVQMLNGYPLIASGFNGRGILIAVLDGGFENGDRISSLEKLRLEKRILAQRDFVDNDISVYHSSTHGTAVLSVLAGNIDGWILGTARGASFLLLRTEDTGSEYPCEEDYWAAGAEYADSCGADIISSSLGYSTFDDPSMDYKLSDLDGNTAFVTRAADIAASKGILVVNSAGNERNKTWKKIICPSDGDSVLAAGAVDVNNIIAYFSSAGPSADRRVKPDVSAMGVSVPVQVAGSGIAYASGTSFSCPVLSGMAASLMQAVPGATSIEIAAAVRASGDRYLVPDSLYGYGIPDMMKALEILQAKYVKIGEAEISVSPNPTPGDFDILFGSAPSAVSVEIFTLEGRLIMRKKYDEFAGRILHINAPGTEYRGVYLVRVSTQTVSKVLKIIKTGV